MSTASTIFALSTSPGRAAIAVVRVSGPAALPALTQLCGFAPMPRQARLATLKAPDTGDVLDQALVLYFQGPASETGEDIVELQVHGGLAVVRSVLDALGIIPGLRPAEPGEFAHRAFINGKLDLTAAEGLADLIDAETDAQRRQAMSLAAGHHARLYTGWRVRLIECQALLESAIDFSDEGDVGDQAVSMADDRIIKLATDIRSHLAGAVRGEIIRQGYRVVIAGPPNAGKSTLLNALARRDAAIVSSEAGTTRDVIEVSLDLGGIPVIATDTAGVRDAEGAIEREGIRRTYERVAAANLVVWLTEAGSPAAGMPSDLAADGTTVLRVANKIDLADQAELDGIDAAISAQTGAGLADLTETILSFAREAVDTGPELVPTSARQAFHLRDALKHLETSIDHASRDIELRAEDLRVAGDSLGRLTGRIDAEDVLDQIFSRFCIGK